MGNTDDCLVTAAVAGDEAALATLLERHGVAVRQGVVDFAQMASGPRSGRRDAGHLSGGVPTHRDPSATHPQASSHGCGASRKITFATLFVGLSAKTTTPPSGVRGRRRFLWSPVAADFGRLNHAQPGRRSARGSKVRRGCPSQNSSRLRKSDPPVRSGVQNRPGSRIDPGSFPWGRPHAARPGEGPSA